MTTTDGFGRSITYLRLSVTDRCDLRCFYCLPREYRGFQTPSEWLTAAEIGRVVEAFAEIGVRHVRLTGGEPLVRKELPRIVETLKATDGIDEISLSSNALRLAGHARTLHAAGISRINVSLDSLNPATFREICGGNLDSVLEGLAVAREVGLAPIKINMVMMRGINDGEAEAMAEYCMEHGFTLRFIETMPVGDGGRHAVAHYMPLAEIRQRLERSFGLEPAAMRGSGPARYFRVGDSPLVVGFITPLSQHFCDSCNRVRLSADGRLHLCLGEEEDLDLRTPLRTGASRDQLAALIAEALQRKPMRHQLNETPERILRPMSALGG